MKLLKLLAVSALLGTLVIPTIIEIVIPEPAEAQLASKRRRKRKRRKKHTTRGNIETGRYGFDLVNSLPDDDTIDSLIDDSFPTDSGLGLFLGAIQDFRESDLEFGTRGFEDTGFTSGDPDSGKILFSQGNLLAQKVNNTTVRYTIFNCFKGGIDCLINEGNASQPIKSNIIDILDSPLPFPANDSQALELLSINDGNFLPSLFRTDSISENFNISENIDSAVNDLDFIIDQDLLLGTFNRLDEQGDPLDGSFRSIGDLEEEELAETAIPEPGHYLGSLMVIAFILGFKKHLKGQKSL